MWRRQLRGQRLHHLAVCDASPGCDVRLRLPAPVRVLMLHPVRCRSLLQTTNWPETASTAVVEVLEIQYPHILLGGPVQAFAEVSSSCACCAFHKGEIISAEGTQLFRSGWFGWQVDGSPSDVLETVSLLASRVNIQTIDTPQARDTQTASRDRTHKPALGCSLPHSS